MAEHAATFYARTQFSTDQKCPTQLSMQGIGFCRRRCEAVLQHDWNQFMNPRGDILFLEIEGTFLGKWFAFKRKSVFSQIRKSVQEGVCGTDNHHSRGMCVVHQRAFFAS